MFRFAVPGIAVPLTKAGCKDTTFDLSLLKDALALHDDAPPFTVPHAKINKHLETLFSEQEVKKYLQEFSSDLEELPREVYHALCSLGKHYRPMIVYDSFCALTNHADFPEFLNPLALAVECFHKASLIHDDIEDNDATRYNEPTLHQRIGLAAAINTGDFLLGQGYRLLGHSTIPPDLKQELLIQTAQAHCELSQGQAREFELLRANISLEQCLETHRLKTAPAFRVALLMGAVSARKFGIYRNVFYEFADLFGISYQLRDDLDDTLENPASAVDCLMRTTGISRESARSEIARLYETYREKTYDVLENVDDPLVKIFMYRLIGKVLKDV
jgi:geranylgeranyl pyrophosphate synthase